MFYLTINIVKIHLTNLKIYLIIDIFIIAEHLIDFASALIKL
jgi:hypothetical protein